MSFLEEILSTKGLVEAEELNEKIQILSKYVLMLKDEVTQMMEDKYVNYTFCQFSTVGQLETKVKSLSRDLNDILERVKSGKVTNHVLTSGAQINSSLDQYQETYQLHLIIQKMLVIHTALSASQNCKGNYKLYDIAKQLKCAEDDLNDKSMWLEHLSIYDSMKSELQFQQNKHTFNTVKLWSECFAWTETVTESSNGKPFKTVRLTLKSDVDKEEVFRTLYVYGFLQREMSYFANQLLKDVLIPIIDKVTLIVWEDSSKLQVKISLQTKKPTCFDVLNNLTAVFNFLSSQLNLKAEDGVSFFSELKNQISEEFCSYFTTNCLSLSIPKSRNDLEDYKVTVEEITAFETLLKETGFLDEEDETINEYAMNVEELFANKTCELYLETARNIMKKDLHDIKLVGPIDDTSQENLNVTVHVTEISPYTFQFPACQISKSTEELLELVNNMLNEIPENTDLCAVRLFHSARTIFGLYCDIVPEYHNRLLATIPQQSAILHNNAMYLAHQVMLLGPRYRQHLPACLQVHTATFVDLVDPLRTLAADILIKQIQAQKKQIISILRDSGLVTLKNCLTEKFPEGIERAIRQCLRQLALLQTVWQHVLPDSNYCKALGLLCSAFVEEIIQQVMAADDIHSNTAAQLAVLISLIQQKAPQVFPEPLEIHRHVKKWAKLGELQLVLNSGLREVDDRWADGMGPLAQEFTPEQVRHLIRALFQISDRRATLLAKVV